MKQKSDIKSASGILILSLLLLIFTGVKSAAGSDAMQGNVTKYRIKIVSSFPHNNKSFTQGLFFHNTELYETTGQYGNSKFLKLDQKTGNSVKSVTFPDKYFAEGSTVLNGKVYILTWMERVVFVYDISTFKPVKTLFNQREGWGLTTDGKDLIMSDGSDKLYFVEPDVFREKRVVKVTLNGKSVDQLNELEYIKGEIWANVYGEDIIYIINLASGEVKGIIDCKNLMSPKLRNSEMVLNGIAFQPENGKIYLTGKLWPKIFQVELVK